MKRVVICTPEVEIAEAVTAYLNNDPNEHWEVHHQETPSGFNRRQTDCLVLDMSLPNAENFAASAREHVVSILSIVSGADERDEANAREQRTRSGDFDCFQRRCLDVNVLAARVKDGAAARAKKLKRMASAATTVNAN